MTYASLYGPFIARTQVEQAVIATLQAWILDYLGEVERQQGLAPQTIPAPPTPDSFRGGLDFDAWQEAWLPQLTTSCQPHGDAERYEYGKYGQWYEIDVAAIVAGDDEDSTRLLADWYGAAIMGILTQQGGLGSPPFATKTVLVNAPRTEFPDPSKRRLQRAVVTVHSFIEAVADESQGPRTPPTNPYANPGTWPTAGNVQLQLLAVSPTGTTSPSTGASVALAYNGGTVTVTE